MKLSEVTTPKVNSTKVPKLFCMVDVNIDYESDSGRDRNKDFKLAVEFNSEAEAIAFHEKITADCLSHNLVFGDGSDVDADDIVNGPTNCHSITPGKGPVAKPPASAYVTTSARFKYEAL